MGGIREHSTNNRLHSRISRMNNVNSVYRRERAPPAIQKLLKFRQIAATLRRISREIRAEFSRRDGVRVFKNFVIIHIFNRTLRTKIIYAFTSNFLQEITIPRPQKLLKILYPLLPIPLWRFQSDYPLNRLRFRV